MTSKLDLIKLSKNYILFIKRVIIFYLFFKIFNDRVVFEARPRIDSRKHDYVRPGGNIEVFNSKFVIKY